MSLVHPQRSVAQDHRLLLEGEPRLLKLCRSRRVGGQPGHLGLGDHAIRVKAVDRAGNRDRTLAARGWIVRR